MAHVLHITARIGTGLWRAIRSLDDHWIGDLIGAVCLALIIVVGFLLVGVFQ
ncbi:MAG: hypothetical protein JJU24_05245 [Natronohydrobacter sp.]|nr:hypothetical protein [Natronohydrobacter sp.]